MYLQKQAAQISVCTLGEAAVYHFWPLMIFEPPGRLHRPDHQSGEGPTCATWEPKPMGGQLAHVPRHIFFEAAPRRLFITSESVPGAPTLELPPGQEDPSGRDDDDAAGQRPGEQQPTLPALQVHPLHQVGHPFCD